MSAEAISLGYIGQFSVAGSAALRVGVPSATPRPALRIPPPRTASSRTASRIRSSRVYQRALRAYLLRIQKSRKVTPADYKRASRYAAGAARRHFVLVARRMRGKGKFRKAPKPRPRVPNRAALQHLLSARADLAERKRLVDLAASIASQPVAHAPGIDPMEEFRTMLATLLERHGEAGVAALAAASPAAKEAVEAEAPLPSTEPPAPEPPPSVAAEVERDIAVEAGTSEAQETSEAEPPPDPPALAPEEKAAEATVTQAGILGGKGLLIGGVAAAVMLAIVAFTGRKRESGNGMGFFPYAMAVERARKAAEAKRERG